MRDRRHNGKLSPEQAAKAVELYVRHGIATTSICERFGVARSVILRVLREAGVPVEAQRHVYASVGEGPGKRVLGRVLR